MGERLLSRTHSPVRPSLPAQARWTDRVAVGTRIRNARLGAGLSETALADGLVSVAYLSRIETNERRPSRFLLAGLAERLDIDPTDLKKSDLNAAEGLRFELAHSDLLLASGRFEEARQVSSDLAAIAFRLGATEVGDAARMIRATALALGGEQDKGLRILRAMTAGPTALATLAASARVHLAASEFATVISIGQRVTERLASRERISHPQGANLSVSVCRAYEATRRTSTAIRLARLSLVRLPRLEDLVDPSVSNRVDALAVSYRSFDHTAHGIESAVASLENDGLRSDIEALQAF